MSDLSAIFYWWFFLFIIGVSVWPLVWWWFDKFWDRGYGLSKIAGLAIVGWLVWMGGVTHVARFGLGTIWGVIILVSILSWGGIVAGKKRLEFTVWMKKNWRTLVFEETLFIVSFIAWALVRGFNPEIEGLEKFMDFGFMNSVVRSKFFPPLDMWWAGEPINYYYFGHFLAGMLTKLSGIDASVTYNLAIAHLFGLGVAGAFTVGSNLLLSIPGKISRETETIAGFSKKQVLLGGFLAVFLVNLGGNWHTIYAFFTAYNVEHPVPPWKLKVDWSPETYWYPNATRFIPYTIHEFPIYSYVVADLHGHVSDIPFVILFLALLLRMSTKTKTKRKFVAEVAFDALPAGFLLGVMLVTNYWDLPIYGLVYGVSVLALSDKKKVFSILAEVICKVAVMATAVLVTAGGFLIYFDQIAEGIKLVNTRSALYQLLILYGWPLFLTLSGGLWLWLYKRKSGNEVTRVDWMIGGWVLVGWFLVLIPEIIYVKDIYIADYHRANTMFKLVYQAFIIFSFAGTYIISRIIAGRKIFSRWGFVAWAGILGVGMTLLALFPWLSIRSYYGNLKQYKGLYGMHFLDGSQGDLAGIYWLKKNVTGQPVVLEASGDSYTIYNRVSAMTGLPTITGWAVHEWLWRGGYEQVGSRIAEVEKIYTGEDLAETKTLLLKYAVEYIFVGEKEREKYGERIQEEKIEKSGKIVFEYSGTKIYKVIY